MFHSIALLLTTTFLVFVATTIVIIFSLFVLSPLCLRSAATVPAGQKYSALAETLDGGEVPNTVNSLPLVNGSKLMKPLLSSSLTFCPLLKEGLLSFC